MLTRSLTRPLAAAAALAGAGAIAIGAQAATGDSGHAAAKQVTSSGVGGVKLGATYRSLRTAGLVGPIRRGCEAAGPNARGAELRAPLDGVVDFTQSKVRKVQTIMVTRGAKARGVGVGSTQAAVRRAFPGARVDHSTDQVFGLTLVKVPRNAGGRLEFAVSTKTKKVEAIGIPNIPFCE